MKKERNERKPKSKASMRIEPGLAKIPAVFKGRGVFHNSLRFALEKGSISRLKIV